MGRAPCCDKNGLKKGPWTSEEDQKLTDYIQKNGYGNWRTLPKKAGMLYYARALISLSFSLYSSPLSNYYYFNLFSLYIYIYRA